jgi:hypothetical protein
LSAQERRNLIKLSDKILKDSDSKKSLKLDRKNYFTLGDQFSLVAQIEQMVGLGSISAEIGSCIARSMTVEKLKVLIEASVEFDPTVQ